MHVRALDDRSDALDDEQREAQRALERLRRRLAVLAADPARAPELRASALEYHATSRRYAALGKQKQRVRAIRAHVEALASGSAVEEALDFYAEAAAERAETIASPERVRELVMSADRSATTQALTDELVDGFFADADGDEDETAAVGADAEQRIVDQVLIDVGVRTAAPAATPANATASVLARLADAPVLVEVDDIDKEPVRNSSGRR